MRVASIFHLNQSRARDTAIGAFVQGVSALVDQPITWIGPERESRLKNYAFTVELFRRKDSLPEADVYLVHLLNHLQALREARIWDRLLYVIHTPSQDFHRLSLVERLQWRGTQRLYHRLEDELYPRVPVAVGMGEGLVAQYRARGLPVRHVPAPVVPPPGCARSVARERLGIAADVPVLLFVGRMARVKRPGLCLEVAGLVAERYGVRPVLLMAGKGPGLERIRRLGARMGARVDVRVLGGLPRTDLGVCYGAADVLLVTSIFEATHFASVEAALLGTPVVSCPVGDVPRIAAACAEDAAGLAAAVWQTLLRREVAGRACQAAAEARYGPEQWHGPWRAAFEDVAARRGIRPL